MKTRNMLISASVIAAFCFVNAAIAQDSPTASPAASTASTPQAATPAPSASTANHTAVLGAVSVVGVRASLAASLETKRNADAIVDAVTAQDIGKFPTTNVADALALIPGVTLDHVMPASERVSIDGLDPSLNISLLDGHPVAQAIWLFGDSPNRGFNFSLLPSELIGKLEVYKSPEARLTEGSLGGLILMHTVDPLAVPNNALSGSLGYNYSSQVSTGKVTGSVFYNFKNDDSTFGVDVSLQHYEQTISRQGMENYGYTPVSAIAAGNPAIAAEVTAGTISGTDLVPNQLSAANFQQAERRNGIFSNIQYRPNANFETTVSIMYMVDDLANYNQSTYAWTTLRPNGITQLGNPVNGIITTGTSVAAPATVCQNDTAGACGQDALTLSDNFARASEITTEGLDWRTKFVAGDFDVTTQAGVSDSFNQIGQVLKELAYEDSFSWDINKGFSFTNPATANNPNYWADYGWPGNHSEKPYRARDSYGQVDFSKDLGGFFNKLRFGARIADHSESQAEYVYGGFTVKTLSQIGDGGLTDLQGASDLGLSGSMQSHEQTCGFGCIAGANPLSATKNYPKNFDPNSYWDNTFNVQQENTAAYIQGDFSNGGSIHGNVGMRVVQTKITSEGFSVPSACSTSDSLTCNFPAGSGWTTFSNTHTSYLPAANLAFDASSDVVLRAAVSETIAYAPYNQLAPYFEANDTVLTAAAGNPNLSPYKSTNFDQSIEWYFAPQSALAASMFYKDISNYIVQQAVVQNHINGSHTQVGFVLPPSCDKTTFVCPYSVTQPVDGGSATVTGFALSYQQPYIYGLGLKANYTYSNAQTSSGGDLPYNSERSYSIGPYFEQGPWTATLTYNWRSKYLAGGYVAGAPSTYVDDYGELDGSAAYAINDHWSINFDAINLNNATYLQYNGNPIEFADEYKTGRQFLLTARFKF